MNITLHNVVDTEANKTFKPINNVVDFEEQRIYQEDISMIAVEFATKMTYRDTVKESNIFVIFVVCFEISIKLGGRA